MDLTRRLAVVAAATLAGPLLFTSAAYADGSHECFSGSLVPTQAGYDLSGRGCAGAGYTDVLIKIRFGPAAGDHRCRIVFPWNGDLFANACRAE